jgi:hypothetical protein
MTLGDDGGWVWPCRQVGYAAPLDVLAAEDRYMK